MPQLSKVGPEMLDGALPAIDGSSLTGVGVDGVTSSANATAITIDSDEKVGIGIASPGSYEANSSHLVVGGTGHSGMTIVGGTAHTSRMNFADGTSGDTEYRGYVRYRHNNDDLTLGTAGVDQVIVDSNGIVTMPKQPCFLASNNGVQANVTGNGATHTINWGTETFDQNADFDGTTFTAPVAGRYLISASLHFQQLTAAADQVQLGIVTSNKAFTSVIYHQNGWGSEPESHKTVLCDMDAADTFTITCRISGESSDIVDVTAGANGYTYVSCALIA